MSFFYTQMIGGIGDLLIYMQKPGSHLGYFGALKERGDTTMVVAHANTDAAAALFERQPYIDHLRFRGKGLRIDTIPGVRFELLKRWDGLPWKRPMPILTAEEKTTLAEIRQEPYVAVHLAASLREKVPPHIGLLLDGLNKANVRVVLLGCEASDDGPSVIGNRTAGFRSLVRNEIVLPPSLRLHIAAAQCARKFVGTLSCFNCAAQIAAVPSFVIVDRSLQEPVVYRMMNMNGSIIAPWNVGKSVDAIYRDAVEWARQ
jgi:hypothetical protein